MSTLKRSAVWSLRDIVLAPFKTMGWLAAYVGIHVAGVLAVVIGFLFLWAIGLGLWFLFAWVPCRILHISSPVTFAAGAVEGMVVIPMIRMVTKAIDTESGLPRARHWVFATVIVAIILYVLMWGLAHYHPAED